MKKEKIMVTVLVASILLSGCGASNADNEVESVETEPVINVVAEEESVEDNTEDSMDELNALGDIEVDQNLFTVELKIPADYVGESTQEELDATVKEKGYKSVTLNDDGSATYIMTKKQHQEMMDEMKGNINDSLSDLVGSEEYPSFVDVKANDDYTTFTITTKSTELDLNESFSVMMFYMYGGMYHIFDGTTVDNIHVDFVNADSGEVISSADSKDMGE